MSVELEYLRMIPGTEMVSVGLVIAISGNSAKFVLSGVLVPVEEPETVEEVKLPPDPFMEHLQRLRDQDDEIPDHAIKVPVQPVEIEDHAIFVPVTNNYAARPKRKYKARKLKAVPKPKGTIPESALKPMPEGSQWGMSWSRAICEALKGGNVTGSELMEHAARIRGTKVPPDGEARKKFRVAFSVSLNDAKNQGLVRRIVENGIDKWTVAA